MRAEGSSPPPAQFIQDNNNNNALIAPPLAVPSRKRKRPPPQAASSPAPSDLGGNGNPTTDLLTTSRADLSSRPILTISRGPVFVPEGPNTNGFEWFKTEMISVNRIGFRYLPAGINPPGYASACRTIESNPTSFRVSWEDRSPFLRVTKDGLGIGGSKGFRSARCNAPIREGKWYMEVKILQGGGEHVSDESKHEGGHVRLGWGRREAVLNAPVGLDGYSYGFRDKTGEKVTLSRPRPYGRPFGTGDVVGMYISLPPRRQPNNKDPHDPAHLKRERIPIDYKGQELFEMLEYPQSKEMNALMDYSGKTTSSASVPSSNTKKTKGGNGKLPERGPPAPGKPKAATLSLRPLPKLPNSRIAFFVNGEPQGIAFQDIYDYLPLRQTDIQKANSRKRTREGVKEHRENPFDDGTLGYYAFISVFNDATVRLNPGPDFEFPPPDDIDAVLDAMPTTVTTAPPNNTTPQIKVENNSSINTPTFPGIDVTPAMTSLQPPNLQLPFAPSAPPFTQPIISDAAFTIANLTNTQPSTTTLTAPPPQTSSPSQVRTWRPASERYPEFFSEEQTFDAREEEEAKIELSKRVAIEKIEEEKRKQREKKRLAAEEKRKAKKEAKERDAAASVAATAAFMGSSEPASPSIIPTPSAEEERERERESQKERRLSSGGIYGPGVMLSAPPGMYGSSSSHPSPSPLRHSTAYEPPEPRTDLDMSYPASLSIPHYQPHSLPHSNFNIQHTEAHYRIHQPQPQHQPLHGGLDQEELDQHEYNTTHEQEQEQDLSYSHSPAPTFASDRDFQGGQSGYTSENLDQAEDQDQELDQEQEHDLDHDLDQEQEQEHDMDVDQDIEAIMGPSSRP